MTDLWSGDSSAERRPVSVDPRSVRIGAEIDKYMFCIFPCRMRVVEAAGDAQILRDGQVGLPLGKTGVHPGVTAYWRGTKGETSRSS